MSCMNSLENIEKELKKCLADKAVFIYWNHLIDNFDYLKMGDDTIYKVELVNLRKQLCSGCIESVSEGEILVIDGKVLETMDVKFARTPCVAHMLLRKQGLVDHSEITPYLFKGKGCRDKALKYITKKG